MDTYKHILFPGRHHVLTVFQHDYLASLTKNADGRIKTLSGKTVRLDPEPDILWIITSANLSNTRRNPVSASKREAMIERFGEDLRAESFVFLVNDLGLTERFADHVIKEVEVQSRGQIEVTPSNTLIACSTPFVFQQYQRLAYEILPVELVDEQNATYSHLRPWDLVKRIVQAGPGWRTDEIYLQQVHPTCRAILEKYNLGDLIIELHADPLVGDEGDITETRNYQTYRQAFEDGAERKYELVKPYIRGGRIVDIGCATGAILKLLSFDDRFRESDLYGIEVARRLYDICEQRKANGEFGNENIFFHQRNIARGAIFPNDSVNTTTTFSLTHEIESYVGRDALLKFIDDIYRQTAPGGVWINVDVVGPEDKDAIVLVHLNQADGETGDARRHGEALATGGLQPYLDRLSTFARFEQFAMDFRAKEGESIQYRLREIEGKQLVEIKLGDLAEFLSKKDYTDNWESEMHETFCFWSFSDWKAALTKAGFTVSRESRSYQNDWIVRNRFENKVEIYEQVGTALSKLPYPPTNAILIAEKL